MIFSESDIEDKSTNPFIWDRICSEVYNVGNEMRASSVFRLRTFSQIDLTKYPGFFGR